MVMKKDKLTKTLTKKGFVEVRERKGNHKIFCLIDPANPEKYVTHVRTMISHGSKKYKTLSDDLLSKISKQLHFDSKRQFLEFIECTYSLSDYHKLLKNKGKL